MSVTTRSGILFATIFIIVKLILFNAGLNSDYFFIAVFSNILLILLSMITSLIYFQRDKNRENSLLADVRDMMKSSSVYAVIVALFLYFYYGKIDKEFTQAMIDARVENAKAADFEQLMEQNPERLKGVKTFEDFIDDERENAELWYSPFMASTISLLGMILISFVYAFVIAWFYRKFYLRI